MNRIARVEAAIAPLLRGQPGRIALQRLLQNPETGDTFKRISQNPLDFAWVKVAAAGGGGGDVVGPSSATDDAVCLFDTTTGKLIKEATFTGADVELLLPPDAPPLDDLSFTTAAGATGKNTWNSLNPLTGYTNLPGDVLDSLFTTSGTKHGIYNATTDVAGVLNDDVVATPNYPANAFGKADQATLELKVNGVVIHTVDLTTFVSGDSLNVNGSGFTNLLAATPVTFDSGDPFPTKKYRTGGWIVKAADLSNGYNEIKVTHTIPTPVTTTIEELLVDDAVTATAYSAESIGAKSSGGTKQLSGVTYDTGITAPYNLTIDNAYRNTFEDGSAITHPTTTNCSVPTATLANSLGDEAKQIVLAQTATVDVSRMIDAAITVNSRTNRTVQSDLNSGGSSLSGLLYDSVSASSTDLLENFDDEVRRLKSNSDFATDLVSNWDEAQSLVGIDSGHNDGLLVASGILDYPAIDYSAIANAPAGNPNYSAAAGTRFYYRLFTNATGTGNFRLNIQGSATLIAEASELGTNNNNVKISLRWPTETGWLDVTKDFNEGSWNDGDGCFSASLGSDKTIPTSNLGVTIGTKNSANSFDKCYVRITVGAGWTGNLTDFDVTWNAS